MDSAHSPKPTSQPKEADTNQHKQDNANDGPTKDDLALTAYLSGEFCPSDYYQDFWED